MSQIRAWIRQRWCCIPITRPRRLLYLNDGEWIEGAIPCIADSVVQGAVSCALSRVFHQKWVHAPRSFLELVWWFLWCMNSNEPLCTTHLMWLVPLSQLHWSTQSDLGNTIHHSTMVYAHCCNEPSCRTPTFLSISVMSTQTLVIDSELCR